MTKTIIPNVTSRDINPVKLKDIICRKLYWFDQEQCTQNTDLVE